MGPHFRFQASSLSEWYFGMSYRDLQEQLGSRHQRLHRGFHKHSVPALLRQPERGHRFGYPPNLSVSSTVWNQTIRHGTPGMLDPNSYFSGRRRLQDSFDTTTQTEPLL